MDLTPKERKHLRIVPVLTPENNFILRVACTSHMVDVPGLDWLSANGLRLVHTVLVSGLLPDGSACIIGDQIDDMYRAYHTHWLESHNVELDIESEEIMRGSTIEDATAEEIPGKKSRSESWHEKNGKVPLEELIHDQSTRNPTTPPHNLNEEKSD